MNGLELSRLYYDEHGRTMIQQRFAAYEEHIAVGMVGMGSECFGFDDAISQDHDWGAALCLWLNKEVYAAIGKDLQHAVDTLPKDFASFVARKESSWGGGRTGVFEIGQFYKQFIGLDHAPSNWREWRIIPESSLATATNGQVFVDPAGEFSAFREDLQQFYPEDIRLKKIACRCMALAQAGQYNFARCVSRSEFVAAHCAETEFINNAISMVFLLNKKYKPFYKWMHRGLRQLPVLGNELHELCCALVTVHMCESGHAVYARKSELMESMCSLIINELWQQGLTESCSDFLLDHGPLVQAQIQDPVIRGMSVWAE